jgi:hypothetical protein
MSNESSITGWYVFAGILLGIAGVLNIIWGIGSVSDSKFFVNDAKFVVSSLHTWGWVTLILGVIQLGAALSLFSGNAFGRVIGILASALVAIDALVSINVVPFWSLCVFALAIIVIYELAKSRDTA